MGYLNAKAKSNSSVYNWPVIIASVLFLGAVALVAASKMLYSIPGDLESEVNTPVRFNPESTPTKIRTARVLPESQSEPVVVSTTKAKQTPAVTQPKTQSQENPQTATKPISSHSSSSVEMEMLAPPSVTAKPSIESVAQERKGFFCSDSDRNAGFCQ